MTRWMMMRNNAKPSWAAPRRVCVAVGYKGMTLRAVGMSIAGGTALDLLSLIAWGHPIVAGPLLVAVGLCVLLGACWDMRVGVAAVLLELLWGSHGRLIAAPVHGFAISLRMVVFGAVLVATLWHLRRAAVRRYVWDVIRVHPVRWPACAFCVTVLVAVVGGVLRHPVHRWFADANAWAFGALAVSFVIARMPRASSGAWSGVSIVYLGALYLVLRTYALLFVLSHDLGGVWIGIYQWVRDTRLGEITVFPGNFPRVFMPSMVLLLLVIPLAAMSWRRPSVRRGNPDLLRWTIVGGSISVLVLSLSRSYWVGLSVLALLGGGVCCRALFRRDFLPWRIIGTGAASLCVALFLAVLLVRLPWPQPLTTAGFGETLAARFVQDAAVSNRWQQLGPLRDAIAQHPIIGSGFGAAVTYESRDPRTLAAFPDGRYTTTAFEWGYVDDLLERGIIGLVAELAFLAALLWFCWRRKGEQRALVVGMATMAVVHATSPYLNHPLGIGVMALLVVNTIVSAQVPRALA